MRVYPENYMQKNRTYYHGFYKNQPVTKPLAQMEIDALNWNRKQLNKLVDVMADGDKSVRIAILKAGAINAAVINAVTQENNSQSNTGKTSVNMPWPAPEDYLNYGWYHSQSVGDAFMDAMSNLASSITDLRDGIHKYRQTRAYRRESVSPVRRAEVAAVRSFKSSHAKVFPKGELPTVEASLTRWGIGVEEGSNVKKELKSIRVAVGYPQMLAKFGSAEPIKKKSLLNAWLVSEKDGVSLWNVILLTKGSPTGEDVQRGYITRVGNTRVGYTYRFGATALASQANGERELLKTLGNSLMGDM